MVKRKAIVIVGPTASGKTKLSIEVARMLNGEIVSADSRQIFKYMDIGTAKPENFYLEEFPHHFVDTYEPDHPYSAGKYATEARLVIDQIFRAKKVPIIVGGSGLYITALLDGLSVNEKSDDKIRAALRKRLNEEGIDKIFDQLAKIDPETANQIHKNNVNRVIRALELFIITGMPPSKIKEKPPIPADFLTLQYGLEWDRTDLYGRINQRVDYMVEEGLIAEVAILKRKAYSEYLNSLQTVGYKEVFQYFAGEFSMEEMIRLIKRNTRRYAKRQITWFKRDKRINWFEMTSSTNIRKLAQNIVDDYNKA